jgi:antitoxin component YwqK of YwqJK toxin-antitoxin module
LYFNEKGQIEYSYKGNKSKKIFEKLVFDKNNKIKESSALLEFHGKKNGEYKLFDTNGEPSTIGIYQAGIKMDIWRTFSGNEILSEINYSKGVPTKSFEKKFPGGSIETKVDLDSIGNGNAKVYFKNGIVRFEGEFSNYRRIKCWKSFDQNGKLKSETFYNLFGEKQKFVTYFENQAIHFEIPFNKKLIDGKISEFYLDGKLKGEYQIEKGIPTPKWVSYSPEGKILGEWNTDNSLTGIFKAQGKDEGIELSFRIGSTIFLSNSALNIEAKLNILYGRVTDEITSSVNGPAVSNIPEILPHLNLRGKDKSDIILYYGMIADKNQIKDSVQYQLNSWNILLMEFVENSNSDSYFIMNDHIIYKLNFENDLVKNTEFLEFENELF